MENSQFPKKLSVPSPAPDKAEQVMAALENMTTKEVINTEIPEETISDDFDLDANIRQNIERDEMIVRDVLSLFDISYDDLVRMDDQSVYSRAVKANPAVLEQVKGSTSPVIEALKIAMGFKPYAEFIEKYGEKPEAIKAAIRKEVEAEMKVKKEPQKSKQTVTTFSQVNGHGAHTKRVPKGERLEDIFGQ